MLMQERVVFVRAENRFHLVVSCLRVSFECSRITVGRGARGGERGGGGDERGRRGVAEEEPVTRKRKKLAGAQWNYRARGLSWIFRNLASPAILPLYRR